MSWGEKVVLIARKRIQRANAAQIDVGCAAAGSEHLSDAESAPEGAFARTAFHSCAANSLVSP